MAKNSEGPGQDEYRLAHGQSHSLLEANAREKCLQQPAPSSSTESSLPLDLSIRPPVHQAHGTHQPKRRRDRPQSPPIEAAPLDPILAALMQQPSTLALGALAQYHLLKAAQQHEPTHNQAPPGDLPRRNRPDEQRSDPSSPSDSATSSSQSPSAAAPSADSASDLRHRTEQLTTTTTGAQESGFPSAAPINPFIGATLPFGGLHPYMVSYPHLLIDCPRMRLAHSFGSPGWPVNYGPNLHQAASESSAKVKQARTTRKNRKQTESDRSSPIPPKQRATDAPFMPFPPLYPFLPFPPFATSNLFQPFATSTPYPPFATTNPYPPFAPAAPIATDDSVATDAAVAPVATGSSVSPDAPVDAQSSADRESDYRGESLESHQAQQQAIPETIRNLFNRTKRTPDDGTLLERFRNLTAYLRSQDATYWIRNPDMRWVLETGERFFSSGQPPAAR